MGNFDRLKMRIKYKEFRGLSVCGFRKPDRPLSELFPTADEIVLATKACFQKLGSSASIIYEIPDLRFDAVGTDGLLELAVPDPKGDHIAVIVDVLALSLTNAQQTVEDIQESCRIIQAKHSQVMGIVEISEEDYLQRLKDSAELMATELRR